MIEIKDYDYSTVRWIVLIERNEGGRFFGIHIDCIYKMEFEDSCNDFYVIRYTDEEKQEQEIKVKSLEVSREKINKFYEKIEIIK